MRLFEAGLAAPLDADRARRPAAPRPVGYLVRLFKASTGLPPMAYLAQLRAEHAATLLLHSDQPVTSISQAVGWPDQNYFARRFKAHYGLSATTYRARFAAGADRLRSSGSRARNPPDGAKAIPAVSGAGIVPGQGTQD